MTLEPEDRTDVGERERELAAALDAQRPVPGAGFRGALGRHLAALDPGYGPRPVRLRLLVAGCLGGGGVLIGLGALVAATVL